jgi:lipopolysaccharide/colanic/teichoic acid biosynthesis glycosyltransferase
MKTLNSIFISFVLLFILSPVLLLIALLIKIESPGPAAIKVQRTAGNGRKILLYRFRTAWVKPDSRIIDTRNKTRLGKFLFRYRLDYMPQLFNSVKGEIPVTTSLL